MAKDEDKAPKAKPAKKNFDDLCNERGVSDFNKALVKGIKSLPEGAEMSDKELDDALIEVSNIVLR